QVDKEVFAAVMTLYADKLPAQFKPASLQQPNVDRLTNDVYSQSAFAEYNTLNTLMTGDAQEVVKRLESDPGYTIAQQMADAYFDNVAPEYDRIRLNISGLVRDYMRALMELSPKEARIFPNANSTLR